MKLLLVTEREDLKELLIFHLRPVGFEIVHYINPLKAMDNIDEIEPDVVLFNGVDFPRHWKPFLSLLREQRTREQSVFVLLKARQFPFEEAAKALHLGVNGVLDENLAEPKVFFQFEELLMRYGMIRDTRENRRYIPHDYDELEFIITHPQTLQLITGAILDVSTTGACFLPDNPDLTTSLAKESVLPTCSLKLGETIITISAKVIRNNESLALQYTKITSEHTALIRDYLETRAQRALEHLKQEVSPGS